MTSAPAPHPDRPDHYDALVIGAGPAGLYALHQLRQRGVHTRILEAGDGVGGTWYWNRYPGARLHSESHSYQYFFDKELLDEWDWSELFAGQPELERYYNRVADKHDLRRDIELGTTVTSARFDETANEWSLATATGRTYTARAVVSATGPLSAPILPDIAGIETFAGESHHTARWPDTPVSFAGRRVVVIGTGSTAVQIIPQIAREAEHLTVFMRTPNWVVPLNNQPLSTDDMANLRSTYDDLHAELSSTFGGFVHQPEARPTTDFSPSELVERYDRGWAGPGFSKWFGMPYDILTDETANQRYCDYLAQKIRDRVEDPRLAELLVPDHPFGSKPVDCESAGYAGDGAGYYEVFNQPNVDLVTVGDNPIEAVVPEGVATRDGLVEADLIVYATGFDAFVGSLNRIEIAGLGGQLLTDRWAEGPTTLLGIQVSGFPNLFMVGGPHGKGGHGNSPRCAERPLEWIADLVATMVDEDIVRVEADTAAEAAWTSRVYELGNASLVSRAKSYLFGDNVPGRARAYVAYIGALPDFVAELDRVQAAGYDEFRLTRA